MRLALVAATLLLAPAALAKPKTYGVHGMLGLSGEVEPDKVKIKVKGRGTQDGATDDEDLEKNYGIAGIYEVPLDNPAMRIGGRAAFITAEGDDSEAEFTTVDGGFWFRYIFSAGKVEPFAAASAGLTWGKVDPDNDQSVEADGFGYHFLIGGGVTYPISDGLDLFGALIYLRQNIIEAEGDGEIQGFDVTITSEDVVLARVFLNAGVMF